MRAKVAFIITGYGALLALCLYVYYSYPTYRKEEEFWIPQLFLVIMISVTTLYVLFTAKLVEETRRLQQRPLLQVTFREIPDASPLKMTNLFERAQGLMRGVAKVVGGEELHVQPKWLVVELKNIGQSTVRNLSTRIALTVARDSLSQEQEFGSEIERDGTLQITVAPASLPWMEVQVLSMIYDDGMRKYSDFVGNPIFRKTIGQEA